MYICIAVSLSMQNNNRGIINFNEILYMANNIKKIDIIKN